MTDLDAEYLLPPKIHTERIQRAISRVQLDSHQLVGALHLEQHWQFEKACAELRFHMLQFLIANELAPVAPATFELTVSVSQDAISDRITDVAKGRYEAIPGPYVVWSDIKLPSAWLGLTNKEKSYGS